MTPLKSNMLILSLIGVAFMLSIAMPLMVSSQIRTSAIHSIQRLGNASELQGGAINDIGSRLFGSLCDDQHCRDGKENRHLSVDTSK